MIPLSVRQSITRCLPRSVRYRLNTKWMNADIDWPRPSAFCIPNSNEGYFRVNLAGREPQGIVARRRGLPAARGHARDRAATALVNPATGLRAAHAVHVMDATFEGPERQHLPDVVISWDFDAKVLDRVQGPACGLVTGRCGYETPAYYSGNHRPNAFVLGYGAGVAAGAGLRTAGTSSTSRPRSSRRSASIRPPTSKGARSPGSSEAARELNAMCGLTGLVCLQPVYDPVECEAIVRRMNQRIAHRGPDDAGVERRDRVVPGLAPAQHHRPVGGRPHADGRRLGPLVDRVQRRGLQFRGAARRS